MNSTQKASFYLACCLLQSGFTISAQASKISSETDSGSAPEVGFASGADIWEGQIGSGFRDHVQTFGISAGVNFGVSAFGSRESHHLALVSISYGRMLGGVRSVGHWYSGNWELRGEFFSGAEFSPDTEWLVGLTPHLRYNFATGTRWVPFIDGGAGMTATGIGPPDLSGTFEFNLQGGGGVQRFLTRNLAVTLEARYMHWSCAHIHTPNLGLNGITGMIGLTWFF